MSRSTIVKIRIDTDGYNELELHIINGMLEDILSDTDSEFVLDVVYTGKKGLKFLELISTRCGVGVETTAGRILGSLKQTCDEYISNQSKAIQQDLQAVVTVGIKNLDDLDNLECLMDSYKLDGYFIKVEASVYS